MADLRKQRTQQAIQQAFIKLVQRKGFNKLTVIDIADQAMINRQTFYKHYQDKYDLAEKMIADFMRTYNDLWQKRVSLKQTQHHSFLNITALITPDIEHTLLAHRDKIITLRTIQLDRTNFDTELKRVLEQNLRTLLAKEPNTFELTLLTSLLVGTFDYLLAHQELPPTPEIQETLADVLALMQ
ncbi:TetR/AcrR family transcriptional regulator [Agrilactobacillus fermenti]|uniref:TetR/AcrR family transcriptional regulator n=1 Tax=Agrilactobacillus fermenti TaxID=2586909 RepID=UPI001E4965F8|nr:TetR family transcriptional regulator [Agrilactobacillus fermenti]MCD2257083.1 TetR family transcriptional regulator [Agrilactobacillus fermenti]